MMEEKKTGKKKKRHLLKFVILLGVGIGLWFLFKPKEVPVETALVQAGDFVEQVETEGVLRSKTRIIVPAFAMGEMERVDLKVGEPVKKGQPITTLLWDMERAPLRSPIDGVVSKVFRESAGPVQRGEPILEVLDPKRLEIAVDVLTLDATRIRVGSRAVIRGWGGDGTVSAHVGRVSKAGFVKISTLGVEEERTEVILELDEKETRLRREWGSTFHVDVAIEVNRLSDQQVIPVGALVRDGEGWMVWRILKGRAEATPVKVRALSGGLAALASGLQAGESVILYPGDLIHKKMRVVESTGRR